MKDMLPLKVRDYDKNNMEDVIYVPENADHSAFVSKSWDIVGANSEKRLMSMGWCTDKSKWIFQESAQKAIELTRHVVVSANNFGEALSLLYEIRSNLLPSEIDLSNRITEFINRVNKQKEKVL